MTLTHPDEPQPADQLDASESEPAQVEQEEDPAAVKQSKGTDEVQEAGNEDETTLNPGEPGPSDDDLAEAYQRTWLEYGQEQGLVALLDNELKLVKTTKELPECLSYSAEDLLGRSFGSLLTDSSREPIFALLSEMIESDEQRRNLIAALQPHKGDPLSSKLTFTKLTLEGTLGLPPVFLMEVELAETGLEEDEQELPLLDLEPLPVPMLLVDQNDRLRWLNSAAQSLFGFSDRHEAQGELFSMLVVGEGDDMRPLERVLSLKGEAIDIQMRLRTHSGNQFVAEVTAAALRDAEGERAGFVAIFRDVTRKLLDESHGADEGQFQSRLFKSAPVGLALIDSDHRLTTFNPTLSRLLGYDETSMRHRRLEDLVQPNLAERLEGELDRLLLLRESIPITLELQGRRRDGTPRPLSLHLASSREGWGVVAVIMDSSSHRAAIDEVKAMEERYRQLFENNDQTMVLADDDGYIMDANRVACELFDLTKEQMVGRHVEEVLGTYGGSEQRTAMAGTSPGPDEPLPLGGLKLNEKDRQQLERVLREENMAALGHLVAGVAHHINNPLAFIRANTNNLADNLEALEELLEASQALYREVAKKPTARTEAPLQKLREVLEGSRPDQVLERLRKEQKSSLDGLERIAKVTDQLRAFGKLEAQKPQMANVRESLKLTLKLVAGDLPDKVTLVDDLDTIPPTYCQPALLNTLFQALLVNAVEAVGEEGELEVSCTADERNIEVRITDNGPGMPDRIQRNIFNPLFTTKHESLGMGLSVAYSIVRLHDGEMEVDSMLGRGTTFIVRLPIRSPSDGEPESEQS